MIIGTVDGGTVDVGTGTTLALAGSTLNNVTLNGTYQLAGNSFIYIQNNLTLDGTLTLGNSSLYGVLYFESGASQTLDGSGTVIFSGTNPDDSLALSSGTLTIGSGITVQGQNGYLGLSPVVGGSASSITVVNQGTIQANVSGGTIYVEDASTTNTGTLDATNGGMLWLQSSNFTPSGVIEADAGSTITIGGIIDNTGLVFAPTGTGTVAITGTVDGGTVDAGTLTNLALAGSTLNNVTLSGTYQLAGNSFIYIQNNLTLDGTLTLGNSNLYGVLYFESETSQTLGGSGTVVFSGTGPLDSLGLTSGTLTIGAGITVEGETGDVGYSPAIGGSASSITVVNQGTIQANVSGGAIEFTAGAGSSTVREPSTLTRNDRHLHRQLRLGQQRQSLRRPEWHALRHGALHPDRNRQFRCCSRRRDHGPVRKRDNWRNGIAERYPEHQRSQRLFAQRGRRLHVLDVHVRDRAVCQLPAASCSAARRHSSPRTTRRASR